MKKLLIFIFSILLLIGCKKNLQTSKNEVKKTELNALQNFPKPKKLTNPSSKEIVDWQEYNALNSFLERFSSITSNQILINALELKDLILKLKKSNKPIFLNKPSLNSRINILENEALRLADMTNITAITKEDITVQTLKIIDIFSSLNEKINTMFSQKQFEEFDTFHDSISLPKEKDSTIKNNEKVLKTPTKIPLKKTLKNKSKWKK